MKKLLENNIMEILNNENIGQWKNFTEKQIGLPFQQTLEWKKIIEKTYPNCTPIYFFNKKNNEINSLFPFFLVKSRLFGDRIISLPFIDFCGPRGGFDENFLKEIIKYFKENFKDKLNYVEIRLNESVQDYGKIEELLIKENFQKVLGRQQFVLNLENESEENLWKNFEHDTRKAIRKALKSDLIVKEVLNEDDLDDFYNFYALSMRNFGTPQHSKDFFINFLIYGRDNFKLLKCYKNNKLISFLMVFYNKDNVYAAYNFSDKDFLMYQPNDLLYWEIIKWALKNKMKFFDLGQVEANAPENSHAAGIYRFKKKWLAKLYERPYFCLYFDEKKENERVNDKKSRYEKAITIWKKTPMSLIKTVGPKLCAQLGV